MTVWGRWGAAALAALAMGMVAVPGAARAEERELCRFDGERLAEISGLAASTIHEGIVWAHNDSGGGARLYALDIETCEIAAILRVRGIAARDPEALAAGTGSDGAPALWWGDIGDNTGERRFVEIHEIPEPRDLRSATVSATTYRVRLDDPEDAEALMADGDRLWMIGKGLLSGTVWELPRLVPGTRTVRARSIGTEEGLVTDAAMRPGGGYAVRDYSEVRIYAGLPPGELVARQPLPEQIQGEAMTWMPDGTGLIVASEGDDRLLLVPVDSAPPESTPQEGASPEPAAEPAAEPEPAGSGAEGAMPTATMSAPASVAAALEPVDRVGSLAVAALGIGAAVFVASSLAVAILVRLRSRGSTH